MEIRLERLISHAHYSTDHEKPMREHGLYYFGRKPNNDYVLQCKSVSRTHIVLHHFLKGLFAEPMRCWNCVKINEKEYFRGSFIPLKNNDTIQIGKCFKFRIKMEPLLSSMGDEDGGRNNEALMADRHESVQPESELSEIDIRFEAVQHKIEVKTEMADDSIPMEPRDSEETGENFGTISSNDPEEEKEEEIPERDGTIESQQEEHLDLEFPQKNNFQDIDMNMGKTINGESELMPSRNPDIFVPTEDVTDTGILLPTKSEKKKRKKPSNTGEKKHACSVCEKKFQQKIHMIRHMMTHTGEKPYACSECEKKFGRKEQLKIHSLNHTGETLYACTVCTCKFGKIGLLNRHMTTHTVEKPYICTKCDQRFPNEKQLDRHFRKHTGELPFPCAECDKKFADETSLMKHYWKHMGGKPYACTKCDKKYFSEWGLAMHLQRHTDEEKKKNDSKKT